MNDVSEKIAKILEDPESLKMISDIAGSIMGTTNESNEASSHEKTEQATEMESSEINQQTEVHSANTVIGILEKLVDGADIENTIRLLSALKPYMSRRRRDSTEYVVRILGLMKFAGNNGFSEIMKLSGNIGK